MEFQDIMIIIQTCIGAVSLVVSLVTLSKVNQIKKINNNKTSNRQTAIGKGNKQEAKLNN